MPACRRHYPGRIDGTDSLSAAPSTSTFPTLQLGRLLHYIFRGLLSVHSRYNLQTRQVALRDPLHRRLRRLCCLHRRSDCYRVERSSSRAGLTSRCSPAPFTAHRNGDVTTTDLMLHRIANQWGYNLASRSMDLQAVAFPALVAADDGWVQYLSEAEELSVWTTVCNQEVQQATCRF